MVQTELLIIGGGAAGLSMALHVADQYSVTLLCKDYMPEGNTRYAQGGVSAVVDPSDSFDAHINDTLVAGGELCRQDIVEFVVQNGPKSIQWLLELGVPFTSELNGPDLSHLHLTREGGHSHRRVVHVADSTGEAIATTLASKVRAHPNITILEHHLALDLITHNHLNLKQPKCYGIYVLDRQQNNIYAIGSKSVVMATGGAGKAYLYTSNPDGATGDGIAMAWRAGCRIANMEFMQFHPTCLYHSQAKSFLITEAVRGEGGKLKLQSGERFMQRYDERMELAPRDIVARAIDNELKSSGDDFVYLDISHRSESFINEHFPNVQATCRQFGIEISKQAIPVVPAAHYTCGGVLTDRNGLADLPGLYAIGEVSYTGLHGANRMASNSLLECLVFAQSAAQHFLDVAPSIKNNPTLPEWDESRVEASKQDFVIAHDWHSVRRIMWDYVGIVRTTERLQRALQRIRLIKEEVDDYYRRFILKDEFIELRNLAQVAELIVLSALERKESRGLHYILDYPNKLDHPQETIIQKK